MKNIKKYFGLTLIALLFSVVFSACEDKDEIGGDDTGLSIKVFSPTKVVPGQPVTINGSGFGEATEVVFPGGIAVTNFELVTNEMIRVVTPQGINIAAEGEKLIVRSADSEAESPRLMTQGSTIPRAYSVEAGEDVKAKSIVQVFGQDMEFVNKATFIDKDDNTIELAAKDFYRIATNSVSFKIPANIKEGLQIGTFETYDGKKFELPEYNYVAAGGGHWDIKKVLIWENDDPAGHGAVSWNGTYRFANSENLTGEEIAEISMDNWALIKGGEFFIDLEATNPQIRVTSGWWSTTWTGDDIFPGNDRLADNGDGTMTLTVDLAGDPLLDVLDQQHFLLTGDRYTPLRIYTVEQIWVDDEEGHWERKALWKNDGTGGDINWNGIYRFANEQSSSGEEIHTFSMDEWAIIKDGTFRVALDCNDGSNIRITTGWWTSAYGGAEHNCLDFVKEEEDGTKYIEVNIKEDGNLYDNLDAQHLLFTGSGYTVKEIYVNTWVEGGSGPKETVIWEGDGSAGEVSWNGVYRFGLEGHDGNNECIATLSEENWDIIKNGTFYLVAKGSDWVQMRITTGWWSTTWTGNDITTGDERIIDNGDGTYTFEINLSGDPILDAIDVEHFLLTGSGYTPLKLYCFK